MRINHNNTKILLIAVLASALIFTGCSGVGRARRIKVDGQIKAAKDIQIKQIEEIFRIGEKMTFKIRWLGIPVGTVTTEIKGIEIIRGKKAYRLELFAKTNPVMSAIFPVRDTYISFMDAEDLCTLRHEVDRKEGFYRKKAFTDFYQNKHYAYFKNLLDGSEKTFDIPEKVQDTLTAFYFLRTINLKLGDTVTYNIVNSEKNYKIYGHIAKKVFVKIKRLGTFESFLINPYAELNGKKTTRGSARGYFSADSRRLPLITVVRSYLFTKIVVTLIDFQEGKES